MYSTYSMACSSAKKVQPYGRNSRKNENQRHAPIHSIHARAPDLTWRVIGTLSPSMIAETLHIHKIWRGGHHKVNDNCSTLPRIPCAPLSLIDQTALLWSTSPRMSKEIASSHARSMAVSIVTPVPSRAGPSSSPAVSFLFALSVLRTAIKPSSINNFCGSTLLTLLYGTTTLRLTEAMRRRGS